MRSELFIIISNSIPFIFEIMAKTLNCTQGKMRQRLSSGNIQPSCDGHHYTMAPMISLRTDRHSAAISNIHKLSFLSLHTDNLYYVNSEHGFSLV